MASQGDDVDGASVDVDRLLFLVQNNPPIYNSSMKEHHNVDIISKIWSDIGKEFNVPAEKVLVFVETKRSADFIAVYLSEQHIPTTSIHGDRLQRERETALNDFKYNRMRVLVATAVAARGLDIKGVEHVINYDLPKTIDEYVHRIGRTGRVGNRGKASSFFDGDQDSNLAGDLIKILQQANQDVPDWLNSGSYGSGSGFSSGRGFGGTDYRKTDTFNNGPQPRTAEAEEVWG